MKMITIGMLSVFFQDGWFVVISGDGKNTIMRREDVHKLELDSRRYNERMSLERGGIEVKSSLDDDTFLCDGLADEAQDVQIDRELIIPEEIGGYIINYIYQESFQHISTIEALVLPASVEFVGKGAFYGCRSLKKLSSNMDILLGDDAFFDTQLFEEYEDGSYIKNNLMRVNPVHKGSFAVRRGTISIASNAFSGCASITDICLHEGIKVLQEKLFDQCTSLMTINIPSTVTRIGFNTFWGTRLLEKFEESDDLVLYIDQWLIAYKGDVKQVLAIKDGIIGIADQNFIPEDKMLTGVKFPNSMKYIGANSFLQCRAIKAIELPEGILVIRRAAFRACSIKELVIPESVKLVEEWVAFDCPRLKRVIVKSSNTRVSKYITNK